MLTPYQQQLTYIFDRPISKPEWYWDINEYTDLFDPPLATFVFLEKLLSNIKTDLEPYSNDQIAHGLNYIFNNSCSDLSHYFKEAPVKPKRKVKALTSIFNLYRDVFEPRCSKILLANSREPAPELESVCYMFWDVTPLSTWLQMKPGQIPEPNPELMKKFMELDPSNEDYQQQMEALMAEFTPTMMPSPEEQTQLLNSMDRQYQSMDTTTKEYYKAIAKVMRKGLRLNNPICQESCLHGLGHLATFQPDLAGPIIDNFLSNGRDKSAQLVEYAQAARRGMIQ